MGAMKVECPRCQTAVEWTGNPHRPFCSLECKDRDLGKWANEEYRIPVQLEGPGENTPEDTLKKKEE